MLVIDNDEAFFAQHPGRQCRIRNVIGKEQEGEFMSLGGHDHDRRRIIAWKVPKGTRSPFDAWVGRIIRVPFLLFADESVRDDDETLLPVLHEIMIDAAKAQGIHLPEQRH